MWFDSHAHLHLCEDDADLLLDRARAAGVHELLTAGTDLATSRRSVALAQQPGVAAAVGVHPGSADGWTPDVAAAIEELAAADEVVAIGEAGLDFYREGVPHPLQRRAFADHIELAKKLDKALVIHTRASATAAIEMLRESGPPERLVFHCWGGTATELEAALAMGAYVSFAGNVSFKSAEHLRDASRLVPEDRVLVETDSPYLTPVPHRGKPNEPAFVVLVGVAVAEARGVATEVLAAATTANARRLFALSA